MGAPLTGVRVLDLTNVLAGPYASYQLALLGADVVKVEVPGRGDLARQLGADPLLSRSRLGASFLAQNADKRSLTLDLKHPAGREIFERLAERADVVIENFKPGVMDRLGLGWERLQELNSGLVYCAISGFGATGPLSQRPAYDQVVQGLSGIMSVTGSPGTAPLRVGFPICDSLGGIHAAFAIVAALLGRSKGQGGVMLDVSMLDASISGMGWTVSDYLISGLEPVAFGNENRTAAPSGTFATADGQLNIAANRQEEWEKLCKVIGRPDLIGDERFLTRDERKRHRAELRAEIESALRSRSAEAWEDELAAAGVPAARILSVPQALASDQVRLRGLVASVPGEIGSRSSVEVIGSPAHFNGRSVVPSVAPPTLGQHTEAILTEIGLTAAEIDSLRKDGVV